MTIAVPTEAGREPTLGDVLSSYRSADRETLAAAGRGDLGRDLARGRFADGLFLLRDEGALGDLIPGLRFRVGGRAFGPDQPLDLGRDAGPVRVEIDRSRTGYSRDWPAYLARRWRLRAEAYSRFVEAVVERTCGREAGSVLKLDAPDRVRLFLAAVAGRIHAAPYETYSRYLEPGTPFRSGDQALDRILDGDGGNCAEKAMALYLIAHAHGIRAEIVLGGEEAAGKFPRRALRSILDRRAFDAESTRDAQRHWQHYAILCRPSAEAEDDVLCDVAGSNIPFLFLGAEEAATYLDPARRAPIRVAITLEPIRLFYHRLDGLQDVPLDLYYAMEHFVDAIDVVHTVDNELGLLHAGDSWLGVVVHRGRRELGRIADEYGRFVARAGRDPRADLGFTRDLASARHPLFEGFRAAHPHSARRIIAADAGIRRRIHAAYGRCEMSYVLLRLRTDTTQAGKTHKRGCVGPP